MLLLPLFIFIIFLFSKKNFSCKTCYISVLFFLSLVAVGLDAVVAIVVVYMDSFGLTLVEKLDILEVVFERLGKLLELLVKGLAVFVVC